ncbi:MAG: ABC transporter ATP-binding protein [Gammaproteobacteria bacterium]
MTSIFKEYGRIIRQKLGYFLLALLSLGCGVLLDMSMPLLYRNIANGLAEPYSTATLDSLLDNFGMVALFYAGIWLSWRVLEVAIVPLEGGGVNVLEKRCFEVLKQQKFEFFENHFSGSLVKQAHRFTRSFETIMDWLLFQCYQNGLAIIVSFVIFFRYQPMFALYFLIWVVLFLGWSIGFSVWKLKFDQAVAEADSKVGGAYSDAVANIFIVKSFALDNAEQQRIDNASDAVYRNKKIAWILMFVSFAVQGLLTFGIEMLLLYAMIRKWTSGAFQVGEFVMFQSILLLLIRRLWDFGQHFRSFFTALADASEMAEVFGRTDVEVDTEQARALVIGSGHVCFDRVGFGYGARRLFDDFSLTVEAGEKIALVGPSGAGKSTLTKILFRFVEPQAGRLLLDGIDARQYTLASLRRQISLVPQQPELFHRSVRDNITLGRPVSDAELIDAARKARCLEFIEQLPAGFETPVGERGVKLSGGEKQRIAIARALLENAPLVVLDEATSALDSLTEQRIQVAIFELIEKKTAIVIAHRLSTILRMDRIVVLEQGRIVEQGTHRELLAGKGKYSQMWQHQSGGFLADPTE